MLCPNIGTVLPVRKKAAFTFCGGFSVLNTALHGPAQNILQCCFFKLFQIPTGSSKKKKSETFNIKSKQVFSVLRQFEGDLL